MALEVDYVPWATEVGANVYTPEVYQVLATLGTGVEPGLADPQQANTTWRLSSMVAAAVANFISQQLGIAVLDDGNLSNLVTNLGAAISVGSVVKPGRVVTSSAELDMVGSDYAIGLQRTVAVADQVVKLPPTPQVNQEFRLDDLSGNFAQYPVTWTPPVGHNIAGNANWGCNVNRGSWIAHYYGSNTWGISRCAS